MKHSCLAAVAALTALVLGGAAPAGELPLAQTIISKGKAGNLDHVAIDAKRDRLFLANKANNTLDILDLKTGKLLDQKTGQTGIQGVCYAPELDVVFVALGTGGLCNVFDGEKYAIKKTINLKDDADNVRYNPATNMVYVAHAEKLLAVIDGKSYEKKADVKLPEAAEGFEMETKRPRLYVCAAAADTISVVDTEKNEVVKNYPMKMAGSCFSVALDEANHRLYVACRKKPMVVVMDTETGKELGAVDIVGGVDDLWLDVKRKRLFASCGEGSLCVIKQGDGDKLEVSEKIDTPKGAKTSLYVPESGKLYLAVPKQEGKEGPEIRIYQMK